MNNVATKSKPAHLFMTILRLSMYNEWVVKHPTVPAADYHTGDKQDALDTAAAFARELGYTSHSVKVKYR